MIRNTNHITLIADSIEKRDELFNGQIGFYMNDFIREIDGEEKGDGVIFDERLPECGTTACIAGWSHILRTNNTTPVATGMFNWQDEAEAMGLSFNEGFDLFHETGMTDKQAVKALRLIANGENVGKAIAIAETTV